MEGQQIVVAPCPFPEQLPPPPEDSEEEREEEERPFKIDYVPHFEYQELPVSMVPTLEFGGNYYSQMLPFDDARIVFRALLERCHSEEQLRHRRFLILGPDSKPTRPNGKPPRDIKLPLGICADDFVASPPRDVLAPPKRWAVAIDCEMVGVAVPAAPAQDPAVTTSPAKTGHGMTTRNALAGRRGTPTAGLPTQLGRGQGRARGRGPATASNTPTPPKGQQPPAPKVPTERSELAQLCAIDVLTGEVLVNVLVQPEVRVVNWRTRYSGITPQLLREAKTGGYCVTGWAAARSLLLQHVDASTILVGHSLDNDLPMLRLSHTCIVDTALQTAEAVYGAVEHFPRIWRLRNLMRDLAGLTIQHHGRQGHSCVEDALATRELALWCLRFPRRLEDWGAEQRVALEKQAVEREAQRVAAEKKAAAEKQKAEAARKKKAEAARKKDAEAARKKDAEAARKKTAEATASDAGFEDSDGSFDGIHDCIEKMKRSRRKPRGRRSI